MPKVELMPVFSPADCANAGPANSRQPSAIIERLVVMCLENSATSNLP
jgi:hypothetical protein